MSDKFLRHCKRFLETLPKINQTILDGKDNPFFRRELARFEREVIQPMDKEWDLVAPSQKKKIMADEFFMRGIVL